MCSPTSSIPSPARHNGKIDSNGPQVPVAFLLCMFPGTYSVFLAGKAFDASSPRQMTSAVLSDDKMGKVVSTPDNRKEN